MIFLSQDGYAYKRTNAGVPSGLFLTQYLDSFGNITLLYDALIEQGLSDNEILDIILYILGDDITGLTNMDITKMFIIISKCIDYLEHRWNVEISNVKTILTSLRGKIKTLSYECNFGLPKKDIHKLLAQFCYPERYFKPQYQAYRAIGFAYAACGQSTIFHKFCEEVYKEFKDDMADINDEKIRNYIPGQFSYLEDNFDKKIFEKFPTILDVLDQISTYHGPLSFTPRWRDSHFINDPDHEYDDYITISEYEKGNGKGE